MLPAGSTAGRIDRTRLDELLRRVRPPVHLVWEESVSSTHDRVRDRASELAHGTFHLAGAQSAGRGRRSDRHWHSPEGTGLYGSLLLKDGRVPAARLGLFNLLVAVEALEAIEEVTGVAGTLAWPNDLLVEGAKVGGVLLEAATRGEIVRYAVASLGINLAVPPGGFPPEIAGRATALASHAELPVDREVLAAELARRLLVLWGSLPCLDPAEATERWQRRCPDVPGGRLRVRRDAETIEGEAVGLTPQGFLRLRLEDGRIVAVDGEIEGGPAATARSATGRGEKRSR